MRGAIVGSSLVHLVLLVALLAVRHGGSIVIAGPDVVQVALIDPVAPAPPPAPPPEKTAPVPKLPDVKPEKEKGVRIAPPPKQPKPAVAHEETPPPALPYAAVGNAGLRGQVAVDARDFEFTYYLMLVRNKIAQNWTPPSGIAPGGAATRAVVYFRIARGGEVSAVQLESGSGVDFFDRTAVRAVILSDPLPPLPLAYTGGDLGVHFGFEIGVP
jgi:TonB family protein